MEYRDGSTDAEQNIKYKLNSVSNTVFIKALYWIL